MVVRLNVARDYAYRFTSVGTRMEMAWRCRTPNQMGQVVVSLLLSLVTCRVSAECLLPSPAGRIVRLGGDSCTGRGQAGPWEERGERTDGQTDSETQFLEPFIGPGAIISQPHHAGLAAVAWRSEASEAVSLLFLSFGKLFSGLFPVGMACGQTDRQGS